MGFINGLMTNGKSSVFVDHVLFFLVGAINPIFLIITIATPWNAILTPLCLFGMLYGGCTNLIALRKNLFKTPGLSDIEQVQLPRGMGATTTTALVTQQEIKPQEDTYPDPAQVRTGVTYGDDKTGTMDVPQPTRIVATVDGVPVIVPPKED